jgi:hypothetical protein
MLSLLNKESCGIEAEALENASAVESMIAPTRLKFFFMVLPP